MNPRKQKTQAVRSSDGEFVPRLVAWFREHGRALPWRPLPRRERRDAYRVWISEAMLQQTRVSTVIPYYERFLARFPDLAALAQASEEEVLAHWSGLGYYRRARTLRLAAQLVVREHAGVFPSTREALLALPGIGPYTAGAIASLAFDAPEALVDGNVMRVFARLFAWEGAADAPALQRRVWERAAELVPKQGGAGEWNEALMELGALVCLPREPRCGECPLAELCAVHALGREQDFPGPKSRKATVDVELVALLVERNGRWLLQRRADAGRMAGLWELPTRELALESGAPKLFPESWPLARSGTASLLDDKLPLLEESRDWNAELGSLRHTITHHRIVLRVVRGALLAEPEGDGWSWATPGEAATRALTGMAKKVLRARFLPAFARST